MATGNVVVTVVDVGQGQCTFVEIYDDASTPKLIHTLLVDCGSDKSSNDTKQNLQFIADRVSTMTAPAFDCVIFSHSDKDHVSLLKELLDDFPKTTPPTPKVKLVWYGGYWDQYKKRTFNILDHLVSADYCEKSNIKTTNADYTGYNKPTKKYAEHLWQSDDKTVTLYAIGSNVLSDDPDWDKHAKMKPQKNAEEKNRVSIIAGLYYGGASYVICGDATSKTMAAANTLFKDTTVFDNNIMTTLPHHGSRTTGYAVKSGAIASVTNKKTVTTFAATMKSKTISVSAYQKHSHPSMEMMMDFGPDGAAILKDPRLEQKNAHRVTANIDVNLVIKPPKPPSTKQPTKKLKSGETIDRGANRSAETDTNIFTTNYTVTAKTFSCKIKVNSEPSNSLGLINTNPAINEFACWKYITKSDGKFTVEGYSKLETGVAAFTEAPTALMARVESPAPSPSQLSGNGKNVFVRMKLPATGKPVNIRSGFRSRLMQFR